MSNTMFTLQMALAETCSLKEGKDLAVKVANGGKE